MTTLICERGDIEHEIALFVRAAFSPEEREIADLKAQIIASKPRSRRRTILEAKLTQVRARQLRLEVVG